MKLSSVLLCILLLACSSSAAEHRSSQVILRVSAGHDLAPFYPRIPLGASAYALDLVYDTASSHAQLIELDATRVALQPFSQQSAHDAASLCRNVDACGSTQRMVEHGRCVLTFANASAARDFIDGYPVGSTGNLTTGPFRLAGQWNGDNQLPHIHPCTPPEQVALHDSRISRIELRSAGATALDAIEIVTMPVREEWRRLYAHDVDVIPRSPSLYRDRFAEMESVRVIDVHEPFAVTLYFNTKRPHWADPTARRTLAATLDTAAVAKVGCGQLDCAISFDIAAPPAAIPPLPQHITLVAAETDTAVLRIARALRYQLRRQYPNIHVEIVRRPVREVFDHFRSLDYDLALLPLPWPPEKLPEQLPRELLYRLETVAHYQNPELARALLHGDAATIFHILGSDVPVVPLYWLRSFAAVDKRFCGAQQASASSWAWMATLYPCAGGRKL